VSADALTPQAVEAIAARWERLTVTMALFDGPDDTSPPVAPSDVDDLLSDIAKLLADRSALTAARDQKNASIDSLYAETVRLRAALLAAEQRAERLTGELRTTRFCDCGEELSRGKCTGHCDNDE